MAICSALLAAFWAAVGIVVRQRVAQQVPADKAMSPAIARFPASRDESALTVSEFGV